MVSTKKMERMMPIKEDKEDSGEDTTDGNIVTVDDDEGIEWISPLSSACKYKTLPLHELEDAGCRTSRERCAVSAGPAS